MNQSHQSFRLPSRKSDPGRLAKFVPGRLGSIATITVALAVAGLVAGCAGSSSSSTAAASAKTTPAAPSPTPTANSGSSPAPAPQGSNTAPSTATSSPAPASTAGNGTLEGSYTFNLTYDYAAPLGSAAPTQAQIVQAGNSACDIAYEGYLYSCNSERMITLAGGSTPSYSACTTSTVFASSENSTPGTAFCIEETGKVAGITVVSVNTTSSYITLKVTVWQNVTPAT